MRGVFWGVGAVMLAAIGREEDIVSIQERFLCFFYAFVIGFFSFLKVRSHKRLRRLACGKKADKHGV